MKKLISVFVALCLCFSLSAESLDRIISSAKENSPSYQNSVISYQNGLIRLQEMDREDGTVVTVSGTINPIKDVPISEGVNVKTEKGMSVAPSVSVVTPDNTVINGSLGYQMDYGASSISLTPSISLSHTFDFTGFDSKTLDDLNYSKQKIQTELSYMTSEYTFENTVIKTISSLLTSLKSLDSVDRQIENLETQIANIDALGTVSKDSVTYKNLINSLNAQKNTRDSLNKQYENAKENYKTFTGLEWNGVDSIPMPELDLRVLDGGNSEVLIASLNTEIAEANYQATVASQNPMGLIVKGNTGGGYNHINGNNSGAYSLGAGVEYSANNWSVGVNHTSSWDFNNKGTSYNPSLTISGKWTNGSSSNKSNLSMSSNNPDLTLKKYENAILEANNNYIAALTSYSQEAQSLNLEIMNWNFKKTQLESNLDYLEDVLKNQETLFDSGLIASSDLETARFNLEQAKYDYDVMLLDGLILERNLKIFAL